MASHSSLANTRRGSSLLRFGMLSLTLLGALFWARQKLISPTPKMAIADPPPQEMARWPISE